MNKPKLEETKDRRRLHIGSNFVDLNESEYIELIRIFSNKSIGSKTLEGVPRLDDEKMTREAFIKKWLGTGYAYMDYTKDLMRDDLDKVINYHVPKLNNETMLTTEKLQELEQILDKKLNSETKESLLKWLRDKRQLNNEGEDVEQLWELHSKEVSIGENIIVKKDFIEAALKLLNK